MRVFMSSTRRETNRQWGTRRQNRAPRSKRKSATSAGGTKTSSCRAECVLAPGRTPSYRPEERWVVLEPHLPQDLSGKSVLDVGGNAGYFSIQMKLRGAGRCVLVEPYREFAAQAAYAAAEFGVRAGGRQRRRSHLLPHHRGAVRLRALSGAVLPPQIPRARARPLGRNDQGTNRFSFLFRRG